MNVALITIATGQIYRDYANHMIESALRFFPKHDMYVFTDEPEKMTIGFGTRNAGYTEPKGYPQETLQRYRTILKFEWKLQEYDQIFYVDADMRFVAPVGDIFSDGLVATLHPGFVGTHGTPETRFESTAYVPSNRAYYCGGFQGGDARTYLDAARAMKMSIDEDSTKGITAVWHDESHWNHYLTIYPPSKVLGPSYCYPEDYDGRWGWEPKQYPPILVALDKRKRGNHPRPK